MRRIAGIILKGLAALLFFAVSAVALTARSGDRTLYPAREQGIDIVLVSNGYHAGVAVPRRALMDFAGERGLPALVIVTERFRHYEWLEIGWGDADFYRSTPDEAAFQWRLALRALAGLGQGSVLHVVGLQTTPEVMFPGAETKRVRVSPEGFARLAERVASTFALSGDHQPIALGQGLYGPSLFYEAKGRFHAFNVCNHWISDLLDAAGLPTTPGLAFLPAGIFADLRWRAAAP